MWAGEHTWMLRILLDYSRRMRVSLITSFAIAAALLVGCTAPPPEPTPTAAPPAMPEAIVVTGIGSQQVELDIPSGAQSLVVELACSHDRFSVTTLPMPIDIRADGACGTAASLQLPVAEKSPRSVEISVWPDVTISAALRWSIDPIESEPGLKRDCRDLGSALSDAMNADAGYRAGALDTDSWREHVEQAVDTLSDMTPTPRIEALIPPLIEWMTTASTPGEVMSSRPPSAAAAPVVAEQVCAANSAAIVVIGEYGG